MKKIILFFMVLSSPFVFAQEKETEEEPKKHEIKLSASNLIIFTWLDMSYEYLINEESSIGSSVLFDTTSSNNTNVDTDIYKDFSFTPYYRRYISSSYAKGFFVEGFMMYSTFKNYKNSYYDQATGNYVYQKINGSDFTLGFSIGTKFVTKGGFAVETYLGIGRNLTNEEGFGREVMPRGGVSLGYRF